MSGICLARGTGGVTSADCPSAILPDFYVCRGVLAHTNTKASLVTEKITNDFVYIGMLANLVYCGLRTFGEKIMTETVKAPIHLWLVAAVAIFWNGFGCFIYYTEQVATSTTPASLFYDTYPMWMHAVWAISVWGALLASLLLPVRKRFATVLFLISLLGLTISTVRNYAFADAFEISGVGGAGFTAFLIIVAVAFYRYSAEMEWRGVLT